MAYSRCGKFYCRYDQGPGSVKGDDDTKFPKIDCAAAHGIAPSLEKFVVSVPGFLVIARQKDSANFGAQNVALVFSVGGVARVQVTVCQNVLVDRLEEFFRFRRPFISAHIQL
jgi:hypothetical protein